MYGMLFGQNPQADVILATLGLTRDSVGRFRDAYVADGQIVVYTRNGGGNRECWHADEPEYGEAGCRNEPFTKNVPEAFWQDSPAKDCDCGSNIHSANEKGLTHMHRTGRNVDVTRYRCLAPNSEDCACYGCVITYRLPKHPCYVGDENDDFDSTYASIYFRFPEEFAAGLSALDTGEAWDPDQRWSDMIGRIGK
jgi:hypothetical protein